MVGTVKKSIETVVFTWFSRKVRQVCEGGFRRWTRYLLTLVSPMSMPSLRSSPWNQAPAELRERAVEQLPPCSSQQPGVRAAAEKLLVHGKEYLCVVKYSASFAGEQLHSLPPSVSKILQYLRRFSMELNKPKARWDEKKIRSKIQRWLSGQFLTEVIRYELQQRDGRWHLQFDFNIAAWQHLLTHRFGRTVLLTNRMDWTAEQVAAGYSGQQSIERVFRGLKDGEWVGWGPMHHRTDQIGRASWRERGEISVG